MRKKAEAKRRKRWKGEKDNEREREKEKGKLINRFSCTSLLKYPFLTCVTFKGNDNHNYWPVCQNSMLLW